MALLADFSGLPDIVWVKVMSCLELGDRNSVSRTCSRLNEVFHHPSLWHTVRIVLLGDLDESHQPWLRPSRGVIIPERYTSMIQAFGAFFQNVEFIIVGHVRKITTSCEEVIIQLAKNCRLENLMLEIGDPVNLVTKRKPASDSDLRVIGSLVSKAFRLRSLAVTSWPIYPDHKGYDILCCIRDNQQIANLQKLRLFDRDAGPETWFTRNTRLPLPDEVVETVRHFNQLTSLGLHADLLTEDLLMELCNLKWFNHISLLLIQSSNTAPVHISSSSWKKLATKQLTLKVDVTIGNIVASHELFQFFNSEIPLTSVTFSKYSRYPPHFLEHLSACYARTLTKFQDFGDGLTGRDSVILSLVKKCLRVNYFVYYGPLKDSSIVSLAESRGYDWKTFGLKLQNNPPPEDDDEDEVLGVTSAGDFFVKAHQPNSDFYYTDESKELRLQRMEAIIDHVSKILQRKWSPIHTMES